MSLDKSFVQAVSRRVKKGAWIQGKEGDRPLTEIREIVVSSSSKKHLKRKFAKNTTDRQHAKKPAHSGWAAAECCTQCSELQEQ